MTFQRERECFMLSQKLTAPFSRASSTRSGISPRFCPAHGRILFFRSFTGLEICLPSRATSRLSLETNVSLMETRPEFARPTSAASELSFFRRTWHCSQLMEPTSFSDQRCYRLPGFTGGFSPFACYCVAARAVFLSRALPSEPGCRSLSAVFALGGPITMAAPHNQYTLRCTGVSSVRVQVSGCQPRLTFPHLVSNRTRKRNRLFRVMPS